MTVSHQLPEPLLAKGFDEQVFLQAKGACQMALLFLNQTEPQKNSPIEPYLESVLALAELRVLEGLNVPESKPWLQLALEEGVAGRIRLTYAIAEDEHRPVGAQGAFLSVKAYDNPPHVLWSSADKALRVAQMTLAEQSPASRLAVGAANRLLLHALARAAHALGEEYDVVLESPVLLDFPTKGQTPLLGLFRDEASVEALNDLADLREHAAALNTVMGSGQLASLVYQSHKYGWTDEMFLEVLHDQEHLHEQGNAGVQVLNLLNRHFFPLEPADFLVSQYNTALNEAPLAALYRTVLEPNQKAAWTDQPTAGKGAIGLAMVMGLARYHMTERGLPAESITPKMSLAWHTLGLTDLIPTATPEMSIRTVPHALVHEGGDLMAFVMMHPKGIKKAPKPGR